MLDKDVAKVESSEPILWRSAFEMEQERILKEQKVLNNNKKIMIVDDEAFNVMAIEGQMRILGLTDVK
jgi:hypothetical protein